MPKRSLAIWHRTGNNLGRCGLAIIIKVTLRAHLASYKTSIQKTGIREVIQ
jgi:hypothetical protein